MPRPDCPRCGSDLVVAAASTTPSESVLELRSGTPRIGGTGRGFVHWLCRACGHQWDYAVAREERVAAEPDTEPVATTGANPAAELRGAREERGRTLTDVAVGTRIQERHLRALERDAPLEEFPSPAYARFFLREYAKYLRLDPAPLLREFDSRHAPEEDDASPAPAHAPPRAPRTGWRVLVVVSIAALAFIAALPSVLRSDEGTPAQQPTAAATTPPPAVSPDPEPAPTAHEPNGVRAVLRLTEASWVEAVADGEVLEASTLEPGTLVVYRARESLELTLGNAGGVRLRVSGEPVETGDPGEVVTLGFTWQDGEVLSGGP